MQIEQASNQYGILERMRYLGIDFGSKRVGVALSDETGTMAFPHTVLENNAELLDAVLAIISAENVEAVVMGHSQHTDGTDNPIHTQTKEFMTDLTLAVGLPIHLQAEQYSTQEAKRYQGKTDKTDAAAAAIILNNYLLTQL